MLKTDQTIPQEQLVYLGFSTQLHWNFIQSISCHTLQECEVCYEATEMKNWIVVLDWPALCFSTTVGAILLNAKVFKEECRNCKYQCWLIYQQKHLILFRERFQRKNTMERIGRQQSQVAINRFPCSVFYICADKSNHICADKCNNQPGGDAQTAGECRKSKFAFKGDQMRQFHSITKCCTGGDKTGGGGWVDQGDNKFYKLQP